MRRLFRKNRGGGAAWRNHSVLRDFVCRFAKRILPWTQVHGMLLLFGDPRVSRTEVESRLSDALNILKRRDVRRYRVVREHVRHIFVWPGHYYACDRFGGIVLASRNTEDALAAELLGTLVHEATHLRIEARGIPYKQSLRDRIERRCVEEQVDALLHCDLISAMTARKIRDTLSLEWWSDESRRRRRRQVFEQIKSERFSGSSVSA